jgi:hypothetical protein
MNENRYSDQKQTIANKPMSKIINNFNEMMGDEIKFRLYLLLNKQKAKVNRLISILSSFHND